MPNCMNAKVTNLQLAASSRISHKAIQTGTQPDLLAGRLRCARA